MVVGVGPEDHLFMFSFIAETRSFPGELDSARAARHYVTAVLAAADESLVGDAEIVITELAANAVLHARSAFTVTIVWSAGVVRIAVQDSAGGGGPLDLKQGHGLSVVAQLARRWGVDRRAGGKVVWAELPVTARPFGGLTRA
jgi:anti-sigma regulatory factor (Ser/Thr protein kinase)